MPCPCCAYPCRCCRLHNPAGTALGRKLDVKRPTSSVRNPVNFSRVCDQSFGLVGFTLRETLCNGCAALNVAERKLATGLGVTVVSTSIANALSPAAPSLQRLISLSRARVTNSHGMARDCLVMLFGDIATNRDSSPPSEQLGSSRCATFQKPSRSMVLDRPLFVGEISNVDGELI